MPAKLYLIRHGETESNVAKVYQGNGDSKLTSNGILMAQELADSLKALNFAGIYCSDLSRGVKTAEIIAKLHAVSPVILPKLRERHYGRWEGKSFEQLMVEDAALYNLWQTDPSKANLPGAESLVNFQQRVISVLKKIINQHPDDTENICIVGHGGVNRMILFYYLSLDLNSFWKIRQSNCCVNIIEFHKLRNTVALVNSTCHIKKAKIGKIQVY